MLISACNSAVQSSTSDWGPVGSSTTTSSFSAKVSLFELEDLAALLGMAEHQAEDAAVGRVRDGQADDLDLRAVECADDFEQLTDPVLEEDRELGDGRPVAAGMVSYSTSLPHPRQNSWRPRSSLLRLPGRIP